MAAPVTILNIDRLTHDVLGITAEKPASLDFIPGQAADVAINKPGWEKEWRPFTFTSLPGDKHIAFTIKTYPSHKGVTNELLSLRPGDQLLIGEVFGDLRYRGEGVFIAGGAGVTPFIAIFKDLERQKIVGNNRLLFANKKKDDIILEDHFKTLLGPHFTSILSDEKRDGYENGFITEELIRKNLEGPSPFVYLCGPPPMMNAMEKHFDRLGIQPERIVREAF